MFRSLIVTCAPKYHSVPGTGQNAALNQYSEQHTNSQAFEKALLLSITRCWLYAWYKQMIQLFTNRHLRSKNTGINTAVFVMRNNVSHQLAG